MSHVTHGIIGGIGQPPNTPSIPPTRQAIVAARAPMACTASNRGIGSLARLTRTPPAAPTPQVIPTPSGRSA